MAVELTDPSPTPAKPGWCLAVAGHRAAPPGLVARALDRLTAYRRPRFKVVVTAETDPALGEWCRRHEHEGVVCDGLGIDRDAGRCRWVRHYVQLLAHANGLLVFGDRRRWARLLGLAAELGIPRRVVAVPVVPPGAVAVSRAGPVAPPPGPVGSHALIGDPGERWRRWLPPD